MKLRFFIFVKHHVESTPSADLNDILKDLSETLKILDSNLRCH